jgi:hemerythrin-like domain-containing protein
MGTDPAQADTRMMAIVHGALRRDLERTHAVLTSALYPRRGQRRALGEHVVWMMDFLHDHHHGEDEGLWPLVRRRAPATGPLLDSLEADHRRISPAMETLAAAGRRYAATTTDQARVELAAALEALMEVLLPHLDREVEEAMPVVSASITNAEWRAWDHRYNVKPKSLAQLGMQGHWLLEDIDPESYQVVIHVVPPVPRFILLHGFARAYRRRATARWQPEPSPHAAGVR